jgi:hypothetical protein
MEKLPTEKQQSCNTTPRVWAELLSRHLKPGLTDEPPPGSICAPDLAAMLNVSVDRARRILHEELKAGKITATPVRTHCSITRYYLPA